MPKLVTAAGSKGDPRDIERAEVTLTQPYSSPPLQPTRAGQHRVQRQLFSLLGGFLGYLVAGCAERYDIGAIRDTPSHLQTGDVAPSSAGIGVLLADGVEDADAVLEGVTGVTGLPGDLDGDGFDDLLVTGAEYPYSMRIFYGGPRPSDGVVRQAQRSSSLRLDEDRYSPTVDYPRRGDFDGDGRHDLAVGGGENSVFLYGLSGEAGAEQDAALADLMQRWTDQRAFLWYGNSGRPAQVEFPIDAVAFRAGDDLSSRLALVLEEHTPEDVDAAISVGTNLHWLGDVDGDGHGDLALSTGFTVHWGYTARDHTECVSYLYYGGPRLEVGGEARQPDARLPGFVLAGLGDVNGDGLADVVAGDGSAPFDGRDLPLYVLPGSTQRLANDVSVQDLSVPFQISSQRTPFGVGDLDADGIGDLLSLGGDEDQMFFDLVYGSPDLLQRPLDATRVSATFSSGVASLADIYEGGDYDGDGKSDLLLWKTFSEGAPPTLQRGSDQARLIPGNTNRHAGAYDLDLLQPSRELSATELYAAVPSPAGDFDGDGLADITLLNASTQLGLPEPYEVRIKFGATLQSQVIR
jgi:hypothetical protein